MILFLRKRGAVYRLFRALTLNLNSMKPLAKIMTVALAAGVFLASTGIALAAPYDLEITHRDGSDTTDVPQNLTPPTLLNNTNYLPYFDDTGESYNFAGIGSGFRLAAGYLSVTPTSIETTDGHLSDTIGNLQSEDSNLQAQIDTLNSSSGVASMSTTTRSIVTGTGATGFRLSTSTNANVNYSATITTTASIGSGTSGTLVLEEAATNSATSTDWAEVGRCTNGQTITLAIVLQSIQTIGCQLSAYVPTGYYVKIRSINTLGTPTYAFNSGQEVLLA